MFEQYPIGDIKVIVDENIPPEYSTTQFRFPKSKKVRIRNKWSKNKSNFKTIEIERFFKFEDKIIVSPKTFEKLKTIIIC
jgi:hypothetical protein